MEMWCQMSGNGALQWLGDLIAHGLAGARSIGPGEEKLPTGSLDVLTYGYNVALMKNYTVLGPFRTRIRPAPSFIRVFL